MERIDLALLLVRVTFGPFLAWHGLNKLRGGIAGTAGWFGSIGMRWPGLQARTAATSEIVGGMFFAAGLLTPLAAAAMIATMIIAIVTVHWRVGFFIFLPGGGWEYCTSIAVVCAAVSVAGPGRYSVDDALGIFGSAQAGAFGVVLGVLAASTHLLVSWRRPAVQK